MTSGKTSGMTSGMTSPAFTHWAYDVAATDVDSTSQQHRMPSGYVLQT